MVRRFLSLIVIALSFLWITGEASAQLYKVYGWSTPEQGEIELVYWTSFIASSDLSYQFFDKEVNRDNLWAHSFEVEYGITDRFTVAAYFDFEDPADASFRYIRTRAVFFRYRFLEKGQRFIDPAIYVEYYIPSREYADYEELEVRLILEKDVGDLRVVFNPMFEKKTSGSESQEGFEFNYAVGIYYRKYNMLQPGIEFYGKTGELSHFKSWDEQRHHIFPTLDLRFGRGMHWHGGVGFGLTNGSDKLTFKSIFSVEF